MTIIEKLIFDTWNIQHIARHEVVPQEVEEACQNNAVISETYGGRLRVIGQTNKGRMLTVILSPKGEATYYPVTARPASRSERRRYQALSQEGDS